MDFNIENLIKLEVVGLTRHQNQKLYYGLILQESDGDRRIRILIGNSEAQSIECVLRKVMPPRPLTHDIMYGIMKQYGIALRGVVIDMLPDGVYRGTLLTADDAEKRHSVLDARSSDAIALALRFEAPIFIDPALLDIIGVTIGDTGQDQFLYSTAMGEDITNMDKISYDTDLELSTMSLEALRNKLAKAIESEKYEEAGLIKAEINRRFPNTQTSQE